MFAEIGEIIGGTKTLPKVPDCGKKFIMFKSLGIILQNTKTIIYFNQFPLIHVHMQEWLWKMLSVQS